MIEILQGTVYLDKAAPEAGGGGGGDLNEYLKKSSVPVYEADDFEDIYNADETATYYLPDGTNVYDAYEDDGAVDAIFIVNPKEIDPELDDANALDTYVWEVTWKNETTYLAKMVGSNVIVQGSLEEDEETGDHRVVYGPIEYVKTSIVQCTQAEYDALVSGGTVDANTIYIITAS